MVDYDSDDEQSQIEKLRYAKVPKGMFVSGWDDDADELITGDEDLKGSIDGMLLHAAMQNDIEVVRSILAQKPEAVHAVDADGYTPLHRACYENNIEIVKLLLQHNANPNARTKMGWTPLHSACKWRHADCVALLLRHGADVNAESDGKQTPLHVAATVSNCRATAMQLLLHRNIKARAINSADDTAAEIALRTGLTYEVFTMSHKAYDVETGLVE